MVKWDCFVFYISHVVHFDILMYIHYCTCSHDTFYIQYHVLCNHTFCNYLGKKGNWIRNNILSPTLFPQGTPHVGRGPFTTAWAWRGSPSSTSTTTAPRAPPLSSWLASSFGEVSPAGRLESAKPPKIDLSHIFWGSVDSNNDRFSQKKFLKDFCRINPPSCI